MKSFTTRSFSIRFFTTQFFSMKLLLNVILVLVTFLSGYIEPAYLAIKPPKPEKVIPLTVRTDQPFDFDQEKALGGKRALALSRYVPLYTYQADIFPGARKKIESLIEKIGAARLQDIKEEKEYEDLREYLKEAFNLQLSPGQIATLVDYENPARLFEGILAIQESILQYRIVGNPEPLKDKPAVEVLYPAPSGIVTYPSSGVFTLNQVRARLEAKVAQVYWQVDHKVLDVALLIFRSTLAPNLKYDSRENDRRIEEIIQRYPSRIIHYKPGDVLVPISKTLIEEDVLLLSAYQERKTEHFPGAAFWNLFFITGCVVIYNLVLSRIIAAGRRQKLPYELLLKILILTIPLMKAGLIWTSIPVFGLPVCVLPLLLVLLYPDRFSAIWTAIVGAILIAFLTTRTFELFSFIMLGGALAVLTSADLRKRVQIFRPALAVGAFNLFFILTFGLEGTYLKLASEELARADSSLFQSILNSALFHYMGWGFLGGILAGPLALLLLPLLEISWQTASTFKLNRYMDLEHPLLRDLLTKTPGTYQHSMTVAYLAQAAGEAIGANTTLLRIGAYYHDIGKILQPKMFIENQFNGKNGHDEIPPVQSAKIIINHVTNGMKISLENGLPEMVVDLIPQHHGTHLVEYFYHKAGKNNGAGNLREENFRYPGPKPQSVEAAILMIVDAVEAASRAINEPTREKIDGLVRMITEKRIAEGQFDECDISVRDLYKVRQAIIKALEGSFHSRVAYPWQNDKTLPSTVGNPVRVQP